MRLTPCKFPCRDSDMKKKVLIPGLGVAKALGFGCTCNLSFEDLLANPSTALWADKICVPPDFVRMLSPNEGPDAYENYAISSLLDTLGNAGALEILDAKILSDEGKRLSCLNDIVNRELDDLLVAAPNNVKEKDDDHIIDINGAPFCLPYVVAGYASQILAHRLGASCLLDRRFDIYLKSKSFYLSNLLPNKSHNESKVYNEIFSLVVANDLSFPQILFSKNRCKSCKHINRCDNNFKSDVKTAMLRLRELRDSDSFNLIREEIDKIIERCSTATNVEMIIDELRERALKLYKMQKKDFPRIRRWTNIAMIAACPSFFISNIFGLPIASGLSGAAIAGAKVIEEYIKHEESKGSWINFLNKHTTPNNVC